MTVCRYTVSLSAVGFQFNTKPPVGEKMGHDRPLRIFQRNYMLFWPQTSRRTIIRRKVPVKFFFLLCNGRHLGYNYTRRQPPPVGRAVNLSLIRRRRRSLRE